MADYYSDLKKLAEEVNEAFPDKEDLWNMVCTPSVALHLVADIEQLKAENEALRLENEQLKFALEMHESSAVMDEAIRAENKTLRKDADKWQIVQHAMDQLQADERDGSIWSVCARLLISTAHKLNSAISTVTEEGVTIGEEEIGDWRVTVESISVSKESSHD